MNIKEIVKILEEIGTILELKGENPFKARAYFNAARTLESLNQDVETLALSGAIADIKGIGKAISEKLKILVSSGELPYHKELKESIPNGLFDILQIPGMGPKKVKAVYEKLNITTVGELEYACLENRLRDLEGFGQKSQEKVLKSIKLHKKYSERFHYHIAYKEAIAILRYIEEHPDIIRIELAGSLRRKKETVKDIDIVASCRSENRAKIMGYLIDYPENETIIGHGQTKSSMVLNSGISCDLRLVDDVQFPFLLHHSTGSKEHNTAMRQRAKSNNLTMNEYGLFQKDSETSLKCRNEEEIFEKLGMSFIDAELRENNGEIEIAAEKQTPQLIDKQQIRGLFHAHTTYSDGASSVKDMAIQCQAMDFEFLGITDHSKSAFYANGLNEDRVKKQQEEIDRLNEELQNFTIFKGIEADILTDGRLDYTDDTLSTFDFVIASVHSSFQMSEEQMTNRICKALENPYVSMLGHPTGRLLLGREAYPHDMNKILETAANYDRVVEINANPHRLDLDWRWGKRANELGVKTAINPDAHAIDGLFDYQIGIGIARKGWFEASSVLNTFSVDELKQLFLNMRNSG